MNKEISVQYAYKKDGKGERHGDPAERILATEAKKNIMQPIAQALPAHLFTTNIPSAPASMLETDTSRIAAQGLPMNSMLVGGHGGSATSNYQGIPPPPSHQQPRHLVQSHTLPVAPSGLPARPPPSQAGYGGPQGFLPPGFSVPQPPGFAASGALLGHPPGFHGSSVGQNK